MSNFSFRSFVTDLDVYLGEKELENLEKLYSFMEKEYHKLIQDYINSNITYSKKLLSSNGNFRNQCSERFW